MDWLFKIYTQHMSVCACANIQYVACEYMWVDTYLSVYQYMCDVEVCLSVCDHVLECVGFV